MSATSATNAATWYDYCKWAKTADQRGYVGAVDGWVIVALALL